MHCWACDYLSMLGLKLNMLVKVGHGHMTAAMLHFQMHSHRIALKTTTCHNAKVVAPVGAQRCRGIKLRRRQWRQSWHYDNSWFPWCLWWRYIAYLWKRLRRDRFIARQLFVKYPKPIFHCHHRYNQLGRQNSHCVSHNRWNLGHNFEKKQWWLLRGWTKIKYTTIRYATS